jgi:hypothetical protein
MTDEELDKVVERLRKSAAEELGFLRARVDTYSPPVISIDFSDNQCAEAYAFAKKVANVPGFTVDPPNGPVVLYRR